LRKIDLGHTAGILANLGVVAGIIFLGLELRQNDDLMAAFIVLSTPDHYRHIHGLGPKED